ncbi:hypothetical protein TGMAS_417580, partial [Toxoplasma gondii MAS]
GAERRSDLLQSLWKSLQRDTLETSLSSMRKGFLWGVLDHAHSTPRPRLLRESSRLCKLGATPQTLPEKT